MIPLPDTAMVFAAGLGTRMRPLTDDRPKALVEVDGKALIDHGLDRLAQAGVSRAIVNVHHFAERLTRHLEPRIAPQITISNETDTLLETGGGLVRARNHLGLGPIFTLNADTLWLPDGGQAFLGMAAHFEPTRMAALLLLARRDDAVGYAGAGDFFLDENGRLERRGAAVSAPFVYAGAQILSLASIHGLVEERFSLNRIWDDLLADGLLYGHVLNSRWLHVGDPEARDAAEEVLRAQAPA